jgi:hypothetical protein
MYTEKWGHLVPMAAPGTITMTSTGVATPAYAVGNQCGITRISAVVTTAVSGATGSLQFIYRPTPGSATNQVVLGTLNFSKANYPIGSIVYKDLDDGASANLLVPGGQVVFNVSAASVNAGAVVACMDITDSPQNFKAISTAFASA